MTILTINLRCLGFSLTGDVFQTGICLALHRPPRIFHQSANHMPPMTEGKEVMILEENKPNLDSRPIYLGS